MSLLDSLKRLFSGGRPARRVYIVDGARLSGAGRGGERLGPRDQVQILQMLSRFAEREKVALQVAFEGRPLREVAHGENFGTVQVFFAETAEALPGLILDLYRRAGGAPVVISSHPEVEKQLAGAEGALLRPSTFRRGLENGGGDENRGGHRGDPRSNDRRRPRRPRDRRGRPAPGGENGTPPDAAPEQPKDPVRDLIDLVE